MEEYDALLDEQGHVCAICGGDDGERNLAVDHCHTSGVVRGLLCSNCNKALGLLRDDTARLAAAIAYLKRPGRVS
jgi:hypothetical protein